MGFVFLAQAADGAEFTTDLVIVLATAAVIAVVMQRMRLAVIPAYLLAGMVLGPGAVGVIRSTQSLDMIGNLAIILLMFGIGLQLHLAALKQDMTRLVVIGVGSTVAAVLIGWPVGTWLFMLSAPAALLVCMAMSNSSTAVVLRIIAERRELRYTRGKLALAILITQDLSFIVMMMLLPTLERWSHGRLQTLEVGGGLTQLTAWEHLVWEVAIRALGIAGIIVVGKTLLPRLLLETARGKSPEVMMILSVAVAIGAAVATQAMGFSAALGAFLAGFLLAGTHFRHHLSGQLGPLRDLFMAVFFTTVGMKLNITDVVDNWWVIALGVLAITLVKGGAIYGTSRVMGATGPVSIAVALTLSQAGEFSLLLLGMGVDRGIMTAAAGATCIAIVVLSLVLTPGWMALGNALASRWREGVVPPWIRKPVMRDPPQSPDSADETTANGKPATRHVILGGFGPVGRAVADQLEKAGVIVTIIELNPATVERQHGLGRSIVFGDASNAEVLESAGINTADALILTVPDEEAVLKACTVARRLVPDIYIAARMNIMSKGLLAAQAGADQVVIEELVTAEAMRDAVMKKLLPAENAGINENAT